MTKVAILPELCDGGETAYRAVAAGFQSHAKTIGAALDAIMPQLPSDAAGMVVIVQSQRPDSLFNSAQQERLQQLMGRWRAARDSGASLPANEQAELEALTEAEIKASGHRAAALKNALDE